MELYERSGDVFKGASQPSCASPARLRGQHFDELSLSDFRCQVAACRVNGINNQRLHNPHFRIRFLFNRPIFSPTSPG